MRKYVAKDGSIKEFDDEENRISKTNNYILRFQNLFLRYLEGCHIIKFPLNTLGDECHPLHLAATHFCQNYYLYALERIRNICIFRNEGKFESCNIMQNNNISILTLINRRENTPQLCAALQIKNKIIITWTQVSETPKSYKIYKDQGDGWKLVAESSTNFFCDEVVPSKEKLCRYTVRADYGTILSTFDREGIKPIKLGDLL